MVSWVPDLLMPSLVALAFFRGLPRRWVVAMAPSTWLADLDYLLPQAWARALGMDHLHRVATHTLLLPAFLLGGLWLAWRRKARAQASAAAAPGLAPAGFWGYARRPGWPLALLLVSYYLAAHITMDVFTGGVVLLWPLSDLSVFVDLRVDIDLQTGEVQPTVEPGVEPGPAPLDPSYPWLTNEHAAMLAFVLLVLLALLARRLWARRAAASRAEVGSPEPSTKGK